MTLQRRNFSAGCTRGDLERSFRERVERQRLARLAKEQTMTPASTHPDHGDPVRLTIEDGSTIWGYLDLPSGNWRILDHVTVSAVEWTEPTPAERQTIDRLTEDA